MYLNFKQLKTIQIIQIHKKPPILAWGELDELRNVPSIQITPVNDVTRRTEHEPAGGRVKKEFIHTIDG